MFPSPMNLWYLTQCKDSNPWSSDHKGYALANCTKNPIVICKLYFWNDFFFFQFYWIKNQFSPGIYASNISSDLKWINSFIIDSFCCNYTDLSMCKLQANNIVPKDFHENHLDLYKQSDYGICNADSFLE